MIISFSAAPQLAFWARKSEGIFICTCSQSST